MTDNTTELYRAHQAAEAAMIAADYEISACQAADKAFAAWLGALRVLKDEWHALPASDRKSSAETNAEDTEGCDVDELRWYEIALMTYDLNP